MSITDELRSIAAKTECANGRCEKLYRGDLETIADCIDEEYERAMAAAALIAGVPMTDESMAEHGLVKLPKDADGVMWNIGDRTESGQTVRAFGLNEHGWYFVGTVNEIDPSLHRHYKQPTVEDVLRDMHTKLNEVTALYVGEAIDSDERDRDEARIFAEYTSKLRLAGEGE